MHVETNPTLLNDPLWSGLAEVIDRLECSPGTILHEKKPEYEAGLNIEQINQLAGDRGPVFSTRTEADECWLTVFHREGARPVVWQLAGKGFWDWSIPPAKLERTIAYLSGWADLRAGELIEKPKRRQRRSNKTPKANPLTSKQAEIVQVVGECKGNLAEAARRLGKDRKTVEEGYRTAMAKLGKTAYWTKNKTRLLSRDNRGQVNLSADDDCR